MGQQKILYPHHPAHSAKLKLSSSSLNIHNRNNSNSQQLQDSLIALDFCEAAHPLLLLGLRHSVNTHKLCGNSVDELLSPTRNRTEQTYPTLTHVTTSIAASFRFLDSTRRRWSYNDVFSTQQVKTWEIWTAQRDPWTMGGREMHDDTVVGKEPTYEAPRRVRPYGDNVDVDTSSAAAQWLHMPVKSGRGSNTVILIYKSVDAAARKKHRIEHSILWRQKDTGSN